MGTFFWYALYRAATLLALGLLLLAYPVLRLARPRFAKWFRMRFWPKPLDFQPELWFHAVSLGEARAALALLAGQPEAWRKHVLITCATQAGYSYLQNQAEPGQVRYLPWDLPRCYRHLFRNRRVPDLVVVETEIWPTLFKWVTSRKARITIVNGRLSSKTLRWARNPLWRATVTRIGHVAARSERDGRLFRKMGLPQERITLTGNVKYDYQPEQPKPGPLADWLCQAQPLVVFASIATDEIPLLVPELQLLLERHPDLSVLWAPRQLRDREKHRDALQAFDPAFRSDWQEKAGSARVLILDTLGELASCYGAATLSLVGGSFNKRGGQNFLESLQAGTPALVGPSTENFRREVADALAARVIRQLEGSEETAATIHHLLSEPAALDAMRRELEAFLTIHTGAIARTEALLIDLDIYPRDGEGQAP